MQNSSESIKTKKQVRFKLVLDEQSAETAKKPKAIQNTSMKETPKRLFEHRYNIDPLQAISGSKGKKRRTYFESVAKLKNLARNITQASSMYELGNCSKNKHFARHEDHQPSHFWGNHNFQHEHLKKCASPANFNTTIQPNSDYAFDELFETKHRLQKAQFKYKDREFEILKRQISKKEDQLGIIKKKYNHEKRILGEQIQILTKSNQDSQKLNEELNNVVKKHEITIERLQKELFLERSQLKDLSRSEGRKSPQYESPIVEKVSRIKRSREESPIQMKKNIAILQNRLRRAQKMNHQFQGIICDLHLTNIMYRQQLNSCGRSRTKEFLEAEKSLKQILKHK